MRRFRNGEQHQLWRQRHPERTFALGMILAMLVTATLSSIDGADPRSAGRKSPGQSRQRIPYEVFFDKPLELISQQPTSSTSTGTPPASKPAEKRPVAAEPGPAVAGKSDDAESEWNDLISLAELQSEVKTIRNELTQILANQGQFNKNFKLAAVNGTELAVLAAIAPHLEGSFTWKENAKFARDFGAELSEAASGLGRENFDKTKGAFVKLKMILDGSIPADAGDVADSRVFHEFAPRKKVMRRIEAGKNMLKQNINSEARFKSLADQIRHESELIAALTAVIKSKGYDYTDEADFQNFADSLIESAKEASESVANESYDQFKSAIDKMNKSCTDCHGAYGNG